jgi:uncharacterized DUF497 family protein
MDIVYRLQGMEFEWDENKSTANIQKHGVTFEEAAEVFLDPFYQTGDASADDKEERDFIIGILSPSDFYWLCTRSVWRARGSFLPALPPVSKGKSMKKQTDKTPITEEGFELRLRSRTSKPVTIHIPADALASLEKIAAGRDMSVEALLKLYVGQSMRQDLAKLSADRVMEKTEQVLRQHIRSKDEVSAILKEIRVEAVS